MKNVLILSAGRRVELVQHFRRAAASLTSDIKIIAADASELAPALYAADKWVRLDRADSETYVERLRDVIIGHDVGVVVPTIDPELSVLARHRVDIERDTGARILVADERTISTCNDKVLTAGYLEAQGFGVPPLVTDPVALTDSDFPVFLKPRSGSSGVGATVVNTREELAHLLANTENPMVQQIARGQEYTVDCFSDFEGVPLSAVPRLRIALRGGEILQGRIERNADITDQVVPLLEKLRVPGPSTIQCFLDNGNVQFIEINPRFGGGAPMSIAAGADSCLKILKLMNGEGLEFSDAFEHGLTFLRFDQAICLDAAGEVVTR